MKIIFRLWLYRFNFALLTHDDVKQRAWQTLQWQIANGIQHVRTHVDVSDASLTALKAMLEVKEEIKPWVDLQISVMRHKPSLLTRRA